MAERWINPRLITYITQKKCSNYYAKHYRIVKELQRGEIGCVLSHRLVYQKMIDDHIDRAIILEDDVHFDNDLLEILPSLEKLAIKKYVIKLDNNCNKKIYGAKRLFPLHRITLSKNYFARYVHINHHGCWSTYGYYIDIKAAKKMLEINKPIYLVADEWNYFKRYIKLRIINKQIVHTRDDFESIIGTR